MNKRKLTYIVLKILFLLATTIIIFSMWTDIDNLKSDINILEHNARNQNISINPIQYINHTIKEIEIVTINNSILLEINKTITEDIIKLQDDLIKARNKIKSLHKAEEDIQENKPITITEYIKKNGI